MSDSQITRERPELRRMTATLPKESLEQIKRAVAGVVRYFPCHHLRKPLVTAAVYRVLYEAFGIARINQINARNLPAALGHLKQMEIHAHAKYQECRQQERDFMKKTLREVAGLAPKNPVRH